MASHVYILNNLNFFKGQKVWLFPEFSSILYVRPDRPSVSFTSFRHPGKEWGKPVSFI